MQTANSLQLINLWVLKFTVLCNTSPYFFTNNYQTCSGNCRLCSGSWSNHSYSCISHTGNCLNYSANWKTLSGSWSSHSYTCPSHSGSCPNHSGNCRNAPDTSLTNNYYTLFISRNSFINNTIQTL
jgi:hypothetical protein